MGSIKVDSDGVPYWEQPIGTHWDYTVNWETRMRSVSDTVVSAVWSVITSGIAFSSATHNASGVHTMWCQPSAVNAGSTYYFTSKIFTTFGRVERARIKVDVVEWG